MAKRRITHDDGLSALREAAAGAATGSGAAAPSRSELATAVRYLLEELAELAPGNSVEVRVPPFGAVQCVAGPRHTRGTPANVIETDPETWVAVATGALDWGEAVASGKVIASGARANLHGLLPIIRL